MDFCFNVFPSFKDMNQNQLIESSEFLSPSVTWKLCVCFFSLNSKIAVAMKLVRVNNREIKCKQMKEMWKKMILKMNLLKWSQKTFLAC